MLEARTEHGVRLLEKARHGLAIAIAHHLCYLAKPVSPDITTYSMEDHKSSQHTDHHPIPSQRG